MAERQAKRRRQETREADSLAWLLPTTHRDISAFNGFADGMAAA
jgi:hypothetical protein